MSVVSQEIGRQVADQLFAAERAIDAAVRAAAQLQALIPEAGERAQLSIGLTQPTLEHVAEMTATLVRARSQAVAAHGSLAAVQRKVGLGQVAYGPFVDKPGAEKPSGRLSVVTAA